MDSTKENNTPSNPSNSKHSDENFPIDKWEFVDGFDLLELENVFTDKSSINSNNTWILCDSYPHSTPSKPNRTNSIKQQSNNIDKYNHKDDFYTDTDSILSSNTSDTNEVESERSTPNSIDRLKVSRLCYNINEEEQQEITKNDKNTHDSVSLPSDSNLTEIQVESLKKFEEKLSKALYKVNFIENKTKNILMEVSNSIDSLDELKTSSYRLKSNSGKFKSSCRTVMWHEKYEYYKYLIFLAFGTGVVLWLF